MRGPRVGAGCGVLHTSSSLPQALSLATLRGAALDYAQAEQPPQRLVVLPWGVSASRRGDFVVDECTARVFEANQQRHRFDGRVALDFEHNTLEGTPAYESSSEPRPVAAWALCRVIPGEGLVYENIEWTPDGVSAWQRRLYQDLSPAPVRAADGKTVIALHSTALCRHGELEGLTIAAAAAPKGLAAYFAALSASSNPPHPNNTMNEKLIALLSLLGVSLPTGADEAATAAALDSAITAARKMTAPTEGVEPESAACAAGDKKPTAMSAEIAELKQQLDHMQKEALLKEATAAGKVIPLSAESLKATPLSALKDLVEAAVPGQVKTKAQTSGVETPAKPEPLSAETRGIYMAMGLTTTEIDALAAQAKADQK